MKSSISNFQRSRAGIPSMRKPASREIISASVELWETDVCFLHVQLTGTNVWLPKMRKTQPDVDLESSRSPAKWESWNNPNRHCCAVFPTWQYCLNSRVWWMSEIKRAKRSLHALVHLVTARASLFTDQRMSGLPMRAKYKHFRTICEQTFWQFSNRSHVFCFKLMVVNAWCCDFVKLPSCFYSPVRNIVLHVSLHDLPYQGNMRKCLRQVSQSMEAFLFSPAEIRDSNMVL